MLNKIVSSLSVGLLEDSESRILPPKKYIKLGVPTWMMDRLRDFLFSSGLPMQQVLRRKRKEEKNRPNNIGTLPIPHLLKILRETYKSKH